VRALLYSLIALTLIGATGCAKAPAVRFEESLLRKQWSELDHMDRRDVLDYLGRKRDRSRVFTARKMLVDDPMHPVRFSAAIYLNRVHDDYYARQLVEGRLKRPIDRQMAVRTLLTPRTPIVEKALKIALKDPDPQVRKASQSILNIRSGGDEVQQMLIESGLPKDWDPSETPK